MLIDIHVHTSRTRGLARPDGSRYPTPAELLDMMDAAGIDMAVLLSTVSPEWRYSFVVPEEVLSICAEFPDRLIPFASVDPRMLTNSVASDFGDMLEHYKRVGCRGIGGVYGCYDELGLPRLENVLRACPNLVLLGHSQPFWAEISSDVTEESRKGYPTGPVTPGRVVDLMRDYPNLHGDLSAGSGFNAISRDPDFGRQFLEEFQDRLYFGTDIASVSQQLPIVDYFREARRDGWISEMAYEKITWRNAARLLGLPTADIKE